MSENAKNLLDFNESTPTESSAPSAPFDQGDKKLNDIMDGVPNKEIKETISDAIGKTDDINEMLNELASSTSDALKDKVFAEADSSTPSSESTETTNANNNNEKNQNDQSAQEQQHKPSKPSSSSSSSECPYYRLGCEYLNKIKLPPKVEEYILWKDPKLTGAVFGVSLVLLICLASFSFLSVISTLGMMALSGFGAYRLYLAAIFRIKGTEDDSFEKWSSIKVSLPSKDIAYYCDTHLNNSLNKAKSILLWDNITLSTIVFCGFYFIYCIGSIFNTLTLVILLHVSAFTLPKVYQVYKVQIDSALEKTSNSIHKVYEQVKSKLPFLQKQKTQ